MKVRGRRWRCCAGRLRGSSASWPPICQTAFFRPRYSWSLPRGKGTFFCEKRCFTSPLALGCRRLRSGRVYPIPCPVGRRALAWLRQPHVGHDPPRHSRTSAVHHASRRACLLRSQRHSARVRAQLCRCLRGRPLVRVEWRVCGPLLGPPAPFPHLRSAPYPL